MLDCYYMDVSGDCSKEQSLALYKMLNEDRKEKVDRLKSRTHANKQIMIGAFMQYCLSKYAVISIEDIQFDYNDQGKPQLCGTDLCFNMSHSGDYVVLSVSDNEIGVDIEKIHKGKLSVAKRCFCPEEYEDIVNAGNEDAQDRLFLIYWTIKEAYVKYKGKGLALPFNSFRIIKENDRQFEILESDSDGSMIYQDTIDVISFPFFNDYHLSICKIKDGKSCKCNSIYGMDNVKKVCLNDILNI